VVSQFRKIPHLLIDSMVIPQPNLSRIGVRLQLVAFAATKNSNSPM